jgi:hypothetical protein
MTARILPRRNRLHFPFLKQIRQADLAQEAVNLIA